jgi:hypothetical protein
MRLRSGKRLGPPSSSTLVPGAKKKAKQELVRRLEKALVRKRERETTRQFMLKFSRPPAVSALSSDEEVYLPLVRSKHKKKCRYTRRKKTKNTNVDLLETVIQEVTEVSSAHESDSIDDIRWRSRPLLPLF